jgi:hypothetical protein
MPLIFEQQSKESDKAFAAFSLYLSLGPQRSTEAVAKQLAKSRQLIRHWSAHWRWTERVTAHAGHLATVEREAVEALARSKAAGWLTRQQELREREWEMHEKCIAAARRALTVFMEREKVFANLAEIARILEVASKLGRMASGLATETVEHTGEVDLNFRLEIEAAIKKVYGPVVDVETVGASAPSSGLRPPSPIPMGEGQAVAIGDGEKEATP